MMADLQLNKEIYDLYDIFAAKNAYGDLCQIEIYDEVDIWRLYFHECRYEAKLTMREFENYLIDLMNLGNGDDY